MGAIASQIISITIVYSSVYYGTDQRKHQSSASRAIVRGNYRGPINSPHKGPVARKMFPFDDVIMMISNATCCSVHGHHWGYVMEGRHWFRKQMTTHYINKCRLSSMIPHMWHVYQWINSLAPGRPGCHFKTAIFNLVSLIGFFRASNDNAPIWMAWDLKGW